MMEIPCILRSAAVPLLIWPSRKEQLPPTLHPHLISGGLIPLSSLETVKNCKEKVSDFPVPSRDVIHLTPPGRDLI
jgi:hypothetical protein